MKTFNTHDDNICFKCHNQLDAATQLQDHSPEEGDLNICAYCGNVAKYDADLRLVQVSDIELEIIFEQEPMLREQILQIKMLLGHVMFPDRAILN